MKKLLIAAMAVMALNVYARVSVTEMCGTVSELAEATQMSRQANLPKYKNSASAYKEISTMLIKNEPGIDEQNKRIADIAVQSAFIFPKTTSPERVAEHANTKCLINPPMAK